MPRAKRPGAPILCEKSAAGVIIAAAIVATAAQAVIAAAEPNDDQQDDDPAAVASAKTVITHKETSYELLTTRSSYTPSYAIPCYGCLTSAGFPPVPWRHARRAW